MKSLPYENSTAGKSALVELEKILSSFGCQGYGTYTSEENGSMTVQFQWRGQRVSLEASWKGYAAAWLKAHPYGHRTRGTRTDYERKALQQARISVCSILRDWVKAQAMAIECGILSFEAAFLGQIMLPTGQTVAQYAVEKRLLLPETAGAA